MINRTWQRAAARDLTLDKFQLLWGSAMIQDIRFGQFLTLISRYLQDHEGIPDMWNVRDEDWPDILERLGAHYNDVLMEGVQYVPTDTDNTE